jgi:hypothetical protein
VPQAPHWLYEFRLAHRSVQSWSAVVHPSTQIPSTQLCVAPQWAPHEPQWPGSLASAAQIPPHWVSPFGQVVPQTPLLQTSPALQAAKQSPQFVTEVAVSTHVRPHAVVPAGHVLVQAPLTQTCATPHAVVHEPQWLGSELRSVQLPRQLAPAGQTCEHVSSAHADPPLHSAPTAPQLFELLSRSTQVVVGPSSPKAGAGTSFPGQAVPQAPLTQTCPVGHAWPQLPQLRALVLRETHSELHSVWSAGQLETHAPPTHTLSGAHTVPQAPQLLGFASKVAHAPLHIVRPTAQELVAGKSTYSGRLAPPDRELVAPEQATKKQTSSRPSKRFLKFIGSLFVSGQGDQPVQCDGWDLNTLLPTTESGLSGILRAPLRLMDTGHVCPRETALAVAHTPRHRPSDWGKLSQPPVATRDRARPDDGVQSIRNHFERRCEPGRLRHVPRPNE